MPADRPKPLTYGEWWGVFTEDGTLAAYACMAPSARSPNCSYLARAGVHPDHRGNRLQRRLIGVRMRRAKKLGHDWVFTDTRDNPSSANNLTACGFQAFIPEKRWSFANATYWRKKP